MRLSRLSLHGFKTFADRTDLLLGAGLTAIVGPNGSGKSNLVDAIRWVVGEASAREVRGTRAEQVIFAGGPGRGPLGMAEVLLALEDVEGSLPVEGSELEVSRRVYRDGVSEFRQNGRRVRLRDLDHLLLATGLTESGYAIVAQHDLDQVLQGSPAQRRQLIEVAAGVRFHQQVVQEALATLAATAAAMEGAGGRLAEIEPRIRGLAAEAETAAAAERIQGRLRQLRGTLEREAWLRATAEAQRVRRRHEGASVRLEEARAAAAAFVPEYQAGVAQARQAQAERPGAERALGQTRVELERARGAAERWEERCLELAARHALALRAAAQAERDRAAAEPGDAADDRAVLTAPETARARLVAAETEERRWAERWAALEAARREASDRSGAAAAAAHRSGAEAVAAAAAASRAEAVAAGLGQAADESGAAADRLAAGIPAAAAEHDAARAAAAAAAAGLAGAEDRLSAASAAAEAAEAERQRAAAHAESARGRRAALAATLAAQDLGPIARGARAGELSLVPLLERVRLHRPEDARAVEAGLAEVAGALVGGAEAALEAIARAGEVAELVCWDAGGQGPPAPHPPPGCRPLTSVLAPDPLTDPVVGRLAGGVVLAADAGAAALWLERSPAGRAVLPDGTVIGTGLRRTPAARPGRIEDAGRLAAAEAALATADRELAATSETAAAALAVQAQARGAVEGAREARAAAAAAAMHSGRALEAARRAAQQAEREAGLRRAARGRAQAEAAEARREAEASARTAAAAAAALSQARSALERADTEVAAATTAAGGARERTRAAAVELARAEALATVARERAAERARRGATAVSALGEATSALDQIEREAAAGLASLQAARLAVRGASDAVGAAEAALAAGMAREGDPLAELSGLEGRRAALAAAVGRAESEVAELALELAERTGAALSLAPARDGDDDDGDGIDPERAAREIVRLERRLETLGPVNALAVRQLEELRERTAGLRSAHADCAAALAGCGELAGELRRRADARFDAAFATVSERFTASVAELFDGGGGSLARVEPPAGDGALAAGAGGPGAPPGVQITVAPRGKRASALSLLSGGERALTALAFILALQAVRPSPFYVFDEVDAALDDHRVGRFVDLLARLAVDTQFLVVTHNHATMERADVLLGVTLAGDGTSRVLSVQLDAAAALAEPARARPAPPAMPVASGGAAAPAHGHG